MPDTSSDIGGLICRTGLGDRTAFRSLYDRTSAKLFGVLLRILKDRSEAEEALQDVFIKIWQKAGSYRDGAFSPISWLVAIARNHALDILRTRRGTVIALDEAVDVADSTPDPESAAVDAGERRRIDMCLDTLEGARADAVRGAYLDGYAYAELAERYEVPINTMRTWLRRSLMRLKECLST